MIESTFVLNDTKYTVSPGDKITVNCSLNAVVGQIAIVYSLDNTDVIYCQFVEVAEDYYTFIVQKIIRHSNNCVDVYNATPINRNHEDTTEPSCVDAVEEIENNLIDLGAMTKSKLIELAKEKNIEVKSTMKKADILDIIKKELGMQ